MTFKLWLLSIIISALAPYFLPKTGNRQGETSFDENRGYTPGTYPDHTLSSLQHDRQQSDDICSKNKA